MRDETEAAVAEDDDAMATMVPEQFGIHDAKSADWLVRKLIEAEAHIGKVKEQAQREIRRTQREHDFLLMRYGRQLEDWAKAELSLHKGRRKSLNLLSGTVGFRTVGPKLTVDNESRTLSWAKQHCKPAVVVDERLGKKELNEYFFASGEIPDGTHVDPVRESFYVK